MTAHDRGLDRKGPDGLAWRTHERICHAVDGRDLLSDPIRLHRIQMPRREAELLGKVVIHRLGRVALMDERGERPTAVGRDGDALPRGRGPPTMRKTPFRESAMRTGRRISRAAITHSWL